MTYCIPMKPPEIGELWASAHDADPFLILNVYDFVMDDKEDSVRVRAALILDSSGQQRVSISWVLDHCHRIA